MLALALTCSSLHNVLLNDDLSRAYARALAPTSYLLEQRAYAALALRGKRHGLSNAEVFAILLKTFFPPSPHNNDSMLAYDDEYAYEAYDEEGEEACEESEPTQEEEANLMAEEEEEDVSWLAQMMTEEEAMGLAKLLPVLGNCLDGSDYNLDEEGDLDWDDGLSLLVRLGPPVYPGPPETSVFDTLWVLGVPEASIDVVAQAMDSFYGSVCRLSLPYNATCEYRTLLALFRGDLETWAAYSNGMVNKANWPSIIDAQNTTPLMVAASCNYVDLVDALLATPDLNLGATNAYGADALTATASGVVTDDSLTIARAICAHPDAASLLANPLTLELASSAGHPELLSFLQDTVSPP